MEAKSMQPQDKEFLMREEDFEHLAKLAYDTSGIVLGEHKKPLLYSRIARRIRALGLTDFAQYCDYLEQHQDEELTNFFNAITTNLTSFFRESHHFEFLTQTVISEFKSCAKKQPLRIWSCACSSGQEPYSIAITLAKNLEIGKHDIKILATDLDSNMLNKGRSGEYDQDEIAQLPRDYLSFFERKSGQNIARVKPEVKKLIQFNRLNLLGPWPISVHFDVIFCRNVVIYFNKETQKVLFNRLADQLKEGGYLIIGHSESLHGMDKRFKPCGRTIYQKV